MKQGRDYMVDKKKFAVSLVLRHDDGWGYHIMIHTLSVVEACSGAEARMIEIDRYSGYKKRYANYVVTFSQAIEVK